jgi:hypothetical protein
MGIFLLMIQLSALSWPLAPNGSRGMPDHVPYYARIHVGHSDMPDALLFS